MLWYLCEFVMKFNYLAGRAVMPILAKFWPLSTGGRDCHSAVLGADRELAAVCRLHWRCWQFDFDNHVHDFEPQQVKRIYFHRDAL